MLIMGRVVDEMDLDERRVEGRVENRLGPASGEDSSVMLGRDG